MFTILDRYIGRAILLTSLLVLIVLVVLASIFAFISELDDVGKGTYTVASAAHYILLTIPSKAYLLFAPSVLLGSLLGLGALAGNSELTVMRAAGVSSWRIIRAVMSTGLLLMVSIALIGEYVVPRAEQTAEELRLNALEQRLSVKGGSGLWIKSGDRFVQVRTVMPDYTLLDLTIHHYKGQQLHRATRAARATRDGDDWLLEDIVSTLFVESQGLPLKQIEAQSFGDRYWRDWILDADGGDAAENADVSGDAVDDFHDRATRSELPPTERSNDVVASRAMAQPLVNPELLRSLSVSSESLSLANLLEQVRYLKENALDSRATELAFWSKLSAPFSTLVMLMLSIPFVFGSQRSGGAGQKIFIGIMLGIAYVLVNRLLSQLVLANGFSPVLSAFLPLGLFLIIAVLGIRRTA